MGAYIINIPNTVDRIIYVNVGPDGGRTYISSHRVEDLTPYTEPDLEQVRKEAYDKCMNEAEDLAYKLYSPKIDEAYQRGLNDAWECARKIGSNSRCGLEKMGFKFEPQAVAYYPSWYVVKKYSAFECIEKIRRYEQEEIKVGDEVIYDGCRCVVIAPETTEKYGSAIDAEGRRYGFENKDVKKTGRHFPEIVEVLQKMKEN